MSSNRTPRKDADEEHELAGLSGGALTKEGADALRTLLDNPNAGPARPPQRLPTGDKSLLYQSR